MTDRITPGAENAAKHAASTLRTTWAVCCLFLALFALLAWRVSTGSDPALRARADHAVAAPRRVLVRKVLEKRVIVHLPAQAKTPSGAAAQESSSGAGLFSAPVTRTS